MQPPEVLEQVMQADRFRLTKAWQRIHKGASPSEQELAKWHERANQSKERFESRRDSLPTLDYDPELPITSHREEIVGLLQQRQTLVICGETGSGKSTQLPKFCLEAGLGSAGVIGHTQPRRLAARAVSNRLAEELGTTIGDLVGFKIRFTDKTKDQTLVKLMTDGVLLAETQSDRFLDQYTALIIDEAHERSLNIDFLLGYLRKIMARRPDLKIIITSATIDPERFAEHFADEQGPAPIIEVSGRTYPVEMRYRPAEEELDGDSLQNDDIQSRAITAAVDELSQEGQGDILTFLPTERDIRVTAKHLRGHYMGMGMEKSVEILPLYARLSQAEQNKIFAKHGKRRIVLATNVAESSLTVPGIRYVIDTGLVRISRYAPRSRVRRLPIERVSQASANQRAGRCGRLGPGICIRLYDEDDYETRPKFTTPEIKRSDLASVILQSHVLRLGKLEEFPLLDAPTPESMRDGRRTLHELGALDDRDNITDIGRRLGRLPSDPRVGRMLIEAQERNCLAEVVVIAAAIECQDVRSRPAGKHSQADEAHAAFQDPHSDFLSYLRLWNFYEKLRSDLGRSRLQKALQRNFLSYQGFREWADTVRQLRELLSQADMRCGHPRMKLPEIVQEQNEEATQETDEEHDNSERQKGRGTQRNPRKQKRAPKPQVKRPEGYESVHQALLAGLLSGIAQKGDRHEYKAAGGLGVSLWPGSGLFHRQPRWIVASEIVETSKRYARTVAEIDVEWVEYLAKDLLKHSYSDPHWSSKSGAAMVYRRSTLFGLPIVAGRRTALAPIDAGMARDLMIEHGLVAGDWRCREPFFQHNQELLADIEELAKRTRSNDFIIDRFHLASFYQSRIPVEVFDLNTLRNWMKKHSGSEAERSLWMKPEDLLDEQSNVEVETCYPNEVQVGQTVLPLSYHFEPGSETDGITMTVPQAALRQVSDEALGWLVPGLLEEKIQHLIKSLPKSLRTNFVPAPDVAKKLSRQLAEHPRDEAFSTALCRVMQEHSGERIQPSDFDQDKLAPHLRFLVRVIDDEGTCLAEGRDVEELKQQFADSNTTAGLDVDPVDNWENQPVTADKFPDFDESIVISRGGVKVAAYPTLVDLGESVELRLTDTPAESESQSRQGLTRLFASKNAKSLRNQVSHLPNFDQAALRLSHLIGSSELRSQMKELLVRIAVVENQPLIRDTIEFEARNQRAKVQINVAAQEMATWLPKLAEQAHELRLSMERAPNSWKEVIDDIAHQIDTMFPDDFLRTIPWSGLREYPRYLKAAVLRLEKLSAGGIPKDRKLREPIDRFVDRYLELQSTANDPKILDKLSAFRWMIEEFRVSVFAQTLGTKQTVSQKRLQQYLDSI